MFTLGKKEISLLKFAYTCGFKVLATINRNLGLIFHCSPLSTVFRAQTLHSSLGP